MAKAHFGAMNNDHSTPASGADTVDPRTSILAAAEARFRRYGFRRTTVAEIAADARMSPANLYRHFANKEDIGAECCEQWMQQRLERLRPVVHHKSHNAARRLEIFFWKICSLRGNYVISQ